MKKVLSAILLFLTANSSFALTLDDIVGTYEITHVEGVPGNPSSSFTFAVADSQNASFDMRRFGRRVMFCEGGVAMAESVVVFRGVCKFPEGDDKMPIVVTVDLKNVKDFAHFFAPIHTSVNTVLYGPMIMDFKRIL